MPVKIRLQRFGSKKRPFYFIVAADSRSPRDGKSIEKLGTYNPLTVPATIVLDKDKTIKWLDCGAQPSPTVKRILSFKGVLFFKHLLRGVKLGLFDINVANQKFEQWLVEHDTFVSQEKEKNEKKKLEKIKTVTSKIVAPAKSEALAVEAEPTEEAKPETEATA